MKCAMCEAEVRRLHPEYDGICIPCKKQIGEESCEMADDRAPNVDPQTGERIHPKQWITLTKRNRATRERAEQLVDSWREFEGRDSLWIRAMVEGTRFERALYSQRQRAKRRKAYH